MKGDGRDVAWGCYAGGYGFVVVEKLFMLQRYGKKWNWEDFLKFFLVGTRFFRWNVVPTLCWDKVLSLGRGSDFVPNILTGGVSKM